MAKGALNFVPVIRQWWSREGFAQPVRYVFGPLATGAAVVALKLEADNLGAFLTGTMFLSGILLNLMFQVYGWSEEAAAKLEEPGARLSSAWERTRNQRRLSAIGRLYDSLTWAMLVSLALTVALVILNTEAPQSQADKDLVATTAVMGILGIHLLVVLLTAVNRLFNITRSTVQRHNSSADAA